MGVMMDFMNEESKRLIIAVVAGFLVGFLPMLVQYWDRGYSRADMAQAYQTGHDEALKTNPASDRLEIVCAALWFYDLAQKGKK
jgi:hypothetical protein